MKDIKHAELTERLLVYIITVCYRKMLRRLQQRDLSLPYRQSLKSVIMTEIKFVESESRITPGDESFMSFLKVAVEGGLLKSKIPNMINRVDLWLTNKLLGSFRFYTEDTYKEFHTLLLELLESFETGLKGLKSGVDVDSHVSTIQLIGLALQYLTRGAILETHLKTIEGSLGEHGRRDDTAAESTPDNLEPDEDLEAVQPEASIRIDKGDFQQAPLHKSYKEWLKVMLIYFDAVDVLGRFVAGPQFQFKAINIKILLSPRPSEALLPWKELFTSSNIFSTTNVPTDELHYTGGYVLNYLETAMNANLDTSMIWANNCKTAWDRENIEELRKNIKFLTQSKVPGWDKCALEIQTKLGNQKSLKGFTHYDWIGEKINLLISSNNFKFFKFLRKAESSGLIFLGSQHCEASLASFLPHSKDGIIAGTHEDICAQLEVSCPVSNLFPSHLIQSFDRASDELSEYQSVAAHRVNISSPF
jgi:hypothetical protein